MGFSDMQRMMRQFQKMQTEMTRIQAEVSQRTVQASSGGGAVVVAANGGGELTSIRINPEAIDPTDPEMLADLLLAAGNEALRLARAMMAEEVGKLTGGRGGVPGIPGL